MNKNILIKEIRKGNHLAFKRVFDSFYKELVVYANGYLFDKASSEDVVQDVYTYIWEYADTIEIKTSLKAYLYAMVRNQSLKTLKTIAISDDAHILELNASLISEYNVEEFSYEDKMIIYNQVLKIADSFPDKMKQIFKLKFLNSYKYTEIAKEAGVSINTVKTQLKRAKLKINQSITLVIILLSTYK